MHNVLEVSFVLDSLDHPECLAFSSEGTLYAGGEAGQIYKIDVTTKRSEEMIRLGGFVCGVTVDGNENIFACVSKTRNVVRVHADLTTTVFCDKTEGVAFVNPNFSVFHPDGDLYLTDSGDYRRATGRLIRIHKDGTSESLLGNHLNFPNGLALSADAKTLYMIESTSAKISRMTLEGDGSLTAPETYVQVQGTVPDGMAFDKLGNLYIGCYTPDIILAVDADRNVSTLIEDKTSEVLNRPTNVAFHPDVSRTDLYFANLGWWHIGSLDVGVPGQTLNYPNIP
jgi:gluconolactonase